MAGYELPIGIEIFRGRYLKSFAQPAPLKAGKVEHYRWELPDVDHVFLPGHRIMVQVQSTPVPALRSQSADLRREHHVRQAGRL